MSCSKKYSKLFMKTAVVVCISLIFCSDLFSQPAGGGYAQSYLLRDVGARPLAMAGAYSAIANEPSCLFYNPAGLSTLSENPTFNSSYSFLEFGRTHSSLAYGQSIAENVGIGLAINNFTTGSFVGRDVNGTPTGNLTDWQFAIIGGAAYNIEFASVGIGVKYLSDALIGSGTKANGFGVDIGTKFNVMDMFTFGASVQNVLGFMTWNTDSKEYNILPYTVRTGIGMEFGMNDESYTSRSTVSGEIEEIYIPATRYVLIGLDAVLTQHENAPNIVLGIEAAVHEVLAFRGGIALAGDDMNEYKLFPMTVWGAGVSLKPREEDLGLPFKISFDYSISADYISSSRLAHHISLNLEF
ncbi:MAG: hypothetical protein A2X61_13285 [Ignavibacteria bacterium GWB2_35_12]|nr:MAG: hypothetical protein A2X63_12495 [Ignavibacteria bacterium GWA2_35_8]OGU41434.1 MAG: hypothetical protein A2X61_13285 [Ignavibacteria bacterium GWB2_35_12]OGU95003.1 MAG: hypothetical protein A2220_09555 [Ignavibacteria bacterium RIFOXYA2_FULL_35_10]OGV19390.1 MAG: hypothetical protein A2475_04805 [Ignavibacteria bacterium RIFOXYC2_FULL_35_21]